MTINVDNIEAKKYDNPKVVFFMGDTIKSFLVPLALSCTINKLEQNATVTHDVASIAELNWPATNPFINLSDTSNPFGIALTNEFL